MVVGANSIIANVTSFSFSTSSPSSTFPTSISYFMSCSTCTSLLLHKSDQDHPLLLLIKCFLFFWSMHCAFCLNILVLALFELPLVSEFRTMFDDSKIWCLWSICSRPENLNLKSCLEYTNPLQKCLESKSFLNPFSLWLNKLSCCWWSVLILRWSTVLKFLVWENTYLACVFYLVTFMNCQQ